MLSFETLANILRGLHYEVTGMTYISVVFYVFPIVVSTTIFIKLGTKSFQIRKTTPSQISRRKSKKNTLERVIILLWVSSAISILFLITEIGAAIRSVYYNPTGFFTLWTLGTFLLSLGSLAKIIASNPKGNKVRDKIFRNQF